MRVRPNFAIVLSLPLLTSLGLCEIDSGGGKSSGGGLSNHGSIGESFATPVSQSGSSRIHPGLIEVLYPITASSITDVNTNGIADGWEVSNFGMLGVDPAADEDKDGTNNLTEYLAGTNPKNGSSFFRPQGTFSNGIFQMPITTVIGRSYKIWATRNLTNWTLQSTIVGDGTQKTFEFDETTITSGPLFSPTHPSAYFFRVEILIP